MRLHIESLARALSVRSKVTSQKEIDETFLLSDERHPPVCAHRRTLASLVPVGVALLLAQMHAGCSGPQSTASQSLPPNLMAQLHARSVPASTLGFSVQSNGTSATLLGPRPGYFAPSNAITLPVSFETGLPTVKGRLNDSFTTPFVLDTGAIFTSLEGRTAARAGVRTVSTNDIPVKTVRGVAGAERSCIGVIDRLDLGSLELTNLYANIRLDEYDAGRAGLRRGSRTANLLGLIPAIAGFSYVTIDYLEGTVTVSPRDQYKPVASGTHPVAVPFAITNGSLQVTLGLPNGHRAEFVVDTGSNGEITLDTATIQSAGLRADVERGRQTAILGVGGVSMEKTFTLNWMEVAGHRYAYIRTTTGSRNSFNLIGSGWLRQFRTTFDFRRQLLWLE